MMRLLAGIWFIASTLPVFSDIESAPSPPTISENTTYFTKPLNQHGYVEYIPAMNNLITEGITDPNNNLYAHLLQIFDTSDWQSHADAQRRIVGTPTEAPSTKLIGFNEWLIQRPRAKATDPHARFRDFWNSIVEENQAATEQQLPTWDELSTEDQQAFLEDNKWFLPDPEHQTAFEQLKMAAQRPWQTEEAPLVNQWLEEMAEPLEAIQVAAEIETLFVPFVSDEDGSSLCNASLPHVGNSRIASRALLARGYRCVAEQDWANAIQDGCSILRLSLTLQQEPVAVSQISATRFGEHAIELLSTVIQTLNLPASIRDQPSQSIKTLPLTPQINKLSLILIRVSALDLALQARQGNEYLFDLMIDGSASTGMPAEPQVLIKHLQSEACDINTILNAINNVFDQMPLPAQTIPRLNAQQATWNDYVEQLPLVDTILTNEYLEHFAYLIAVPTRPEIVLAFVGVDLAKRLADGVHQKIGRAGRSCS